MARIFPMHRGIGHNNDWWDRVFRVLLALLLVYSFSSPASALPQKEGYIAICSGSEILYIPLADAGLEDPSQEAQAPTSSPCPWFTQLHALDAADIAVVGHSTVIYDALPIPADDTRPVAQQIPRAFQARGPPLLAA
ncbi:hypothetical protein HH303_16515 [Rhodospirillaceae bacterium KN72]|uniref:DUF2946 domain-containing protein n=1 Tax=Pacificispira spongiicola TaxID=2729598 RepID=A0A7Y0E2S5_9PROT|nr:hypothetical protein [Pacificispira spongiicola]NMM46098.1 hypothetical protein [Pacificispira spongiicola]